MTTSLLSKSFDYDIAGLSDIACAANDEVRRAANHMMFHVVAYQP